MKPGKKLLLVAASAGFLGTGCNTAPAAVEPDGAALFTNYCQPCHTAAGTGSDHLIAAPNIAGLPQWYVEAQLHKFRDGMRGGHFDDIMGMRMRPMSLTLGNDAEVTAVAAHVAALPVVDTQTTMVERDGEMVALVDGDPELGKTYFATCQACHGAAAEGNQLLNAPPLAYQHDWYLLTQLQHLKSGVRGADPRDVTGAQMRPMAQTLPDEQAMKDVIAYIRTL